MTWHCQVFCCYLHCFPRALGKSSWSCSPQVIIMLKSGSTGAAAKPNNALPNPNLCQAPVDSQVLPFPRQELSVHLCALLRQGDTVQTEGQRRILSPKMRNKPGAARGHRVGTHTNFPQLPLAVPAAGSSARPWQLSVHLLRVLATLAKCVQGLPSSAG